MKKFRCSLRWTSRRSGQVLDLRNYPPLCRRHVVRVWSVCISFYIYVTYVYIYVYFHVYVYVYVSVYVYVYYVIFLRGGQPPTLAASCWRLHGPPPPWGVPGVYFRLSCLVLALLFAILAPRCQNIAQDNPKDTILEPTSSKIAPKGPSRRAPDPRKTTKSVVELVVFTLRRFLLRSRSRSEI